LRIAGALRLLAFLIPLQYPKVFQSGVSTKCRDRYTAFVERFEHDPRIVPTPSPFARYRSQRFIASFNSFHRSSFQLKETILAPDSPPRNDGSD
jgi:hypothetical protein